MIRWIETADSYRLSVNRTEDGVAHTLIGVGFGLLALSGTACMIGALLAPILLIRAVVLLLQRYFIEVPLRGGPVRWWWRGMSEPTQPVEVQRFDVEGVNPTVSSPWTRFVLVALLRDGRVLRPFKGLSTGDPRIVDRVARQLNEVLGVTPEEERLSAAPELIQTWLGRRSSPLTPLFVVVLVLILVALLLPALASSR